MSGSRAGRISTSRKGRFSFICRLVAAACVLTPAAAHAQVADTPGEAAGPADAAISHALQKAVAKAGKTGRDVREFYKARDYRPLWVNAGTLDPAATRLLELLRSARADGLDARKTRADALSSAIRKTERGTPEALAEADVLLSSVFATYARSTRAVRRAPMTYESAALAPVVPTVKSALLSAAAAPSLTRYIDEMGWMHPYYAPLREAIADRATNVAVVDVLRANLERARALPADPGRRHVLVDAASARLFMFEDGAVVDSMKVVVGKPDNQTPMMAGYIRYATLNPYWNIPADLVKVRIAPGVLRHGLSYIKSRGYQVLDSWDEDARLIDPATVDWKAVAAGTTELRVRQLPGRDNFMGKMKFMFPNPQGIYLHDTPDKDLLNEETRTASSGCVRLADAPKLGRWLMGKPLTTRSKKPEQKVDLPEVVPVYLTYFTAFPEKGGIAFHEDVYGRDSTQLAMLREATARR